MKGKRCRLSQCGLEHGLYRGDVQKQKRLGTIVNGTPYGSMWDVQWDACKGGQYYHKSFIEIVEDSAESA